GVSPDLVEAARVTGVFDPVGDGPDAGGRGGGPVGGQPPPRQQGGAIGFGPVLKPPPRHRLVVAAGRRVGVGRHDESADAPPQLSRSAVWGVGQHPPHHHSGDPGVDVVVGGEEVGEDLRLRIVDLPGPHRLTHRPPAGVGPAVRRTPAGSPPPATSRTGRRRSRRRRDRPARPTGQPPAAAQRPGGGSGRPPPPCPPTTQLAGGRAAGPGPPAPPPTRRR